MAQRFDDSISLDELLSGLDRRSDADTYSSRASRNRDRDDADDSISLDSLIIMTGSDGLRLDSDTQEATSASSASRTATNAADTAPDDNGGASDDARSEDKNDQGADSGAAAHPDASAEKTASAPSHENVSAAEASGKEVDSGKSDETSQSEPIEVTPVFYEKSPAVSRGVAPLAAPQGSPVLGARPIGAASGASQTMPKQGVSYAPPAAAPAPASQVAQAGVASPVQAAPSGVQPSSGVPSEAAAAAPALQTDAKPQVSPAQPPQPQSRFQGQPYENAMPANEAALHAQEVPTEHISYVNENDSSKVRIAIVLLVVAICILVLCVVLLGLGFAGVLS